MKKKRKLGEFGSMVFDRRSQLGMTQADVAKKIGCRPNYIGYLESGERRPSAKLLAKIAKALDLDEGTLYLAAFPASKAVLPTKSKPMDAWKAFEANRALHTRHGISKAEIAALRALNRALGPMREERDFLFVLQACRTGKQQS